jgi:hypothetical protein
MGIARSTFYDAPMMVVDDTALVEAMHAIKDEFEAYGWRYPAGFSAEPALVPERDRLATPAVAFDQTEFFDPADPRVSMGEVGFVYVPADCRRTTRLRAGLPAARRLPRLPAISRAGRRRLLLGRRLQRLGRGQPDRRALPAGDRLGRPSTSPASPPIPRGCWDWWGYSGLDYFRQSGRRTTLPMPRRSSRRPSGRRCALLR